MSGINWRSFAVAWRKVDLENVAFTSMTARTCSAGMIRLRPSSDLSACALRASSDGPEAQRGAVLSLAEVAQRCRFSNPATGSESVWRLVTLVEHRSFHVWTDLDAWIKLLRIWQPVARPLPLPANAP